MHDAIAELVKREGWRAEGAAARVHYEGAGDRFAVEYYAPTDVVVYWSVPTAAGNAGGAEDAGGAGDPAAERDADGRNDDAPSPAAPIPRDDVPNPLRKRIRGDLSAAGVDPEVERRSV